VEGEEDVDGTNGRFELLDGCDCAADANATSPFHGEGDCCNNLINCTCIVLLESKERHSTATATMELDINNIRIDLYFKLILIKLQLVYKCSDIYVNVF
jgi:hypothetical protein